MCDSTSYTIFWKCHDYLHILMLEYRNGCQYTLSTDFSGGSRNLERGVQSLARRKFLGCHAHFRSRERNKIKYSWKAEPRGPSQKKSRTLSDSVVLVNL